MEVQENPGQTQTQALLTLYTITNNYILQYRDIAFRVAVYSVGLLGACVGLALNDRFRSLWSERARGFLLAVLLLFSIVAVLFIFVINHKCVLLKQRRTILEDLLGYSKTEFYSKNDAPLIPRQQLHLGANWRYALAFSCLIAIATILVITAFSK